MSQKRVYRLYREEGLELRNKTPKRRVEAALRADRTRPSRSNEDWPMDFVHDPLVAERKIRLLTVIDTFFRFYPVFDVRFAYRGEDEPARIWSAIGAEVSLASNPARRAYRFAKLMVPLARLWRHRAK